MELKTPWPVFVTAYLARTVCLTLSPLSFYYHFIFKLATILDTCEPYTRDDISRDLDSAWDAISAATVDEQIQAKKWNNWMELWSETQKYPYLKNIYTNIQQHILLGFYECNRQGYYSRGRQVGAQTSETDLRHVAQTIVLAGYRLRHPLYLLWIHIYRLNLLLFAKILQNWWPGTKAPFGPLLPG